MTSPTDDAAIARAAATVLLHNGDRLRELTGDQAADFLLASAAETLAKTPNTPPPIPVWKARRTVLEGETTE
jgi:hypothetical protein